MVLKPWAVTSQILESAVAKAKEACERSVEEEQKKVRDLESRLRSVTEVSGAHGRQSGRCSRWD